jgi:hypothetical protein
LKGNHELIELDIPFFENYFEIYVSLLYGNNAALLSTIIGKEKAIEEYDSILKSNF